MPLTFKMRLIEVELVVESFVGHPSMLTLLFCTCWLCPMQEYIMYSGNNHFIISKQLWMKLSIFWDYHNSATEVTVTSVKSNIHVVVMEANTPCCCLMQFGYI